MDFDSQLDRLIEDVIKAAATRKKPFKPVTVLIDGPSGAGKTWACAALADRAGWRVVHLDEFYPGWHGLEQGSRMVAEQVLRETNPGYWRWDWEAGAPGEWASLMHATISSWRVSVRLLRKTLLRLRSAAP